MSRARTLFSSRNSASPTSFRSRITRTAALALITGVTAGTLVGLTAPAAEAASGTAGGRVFRDYNMNGAYDTAATGTPSTTAVDVGISGVTVRAYDKDNNVVATGTTTAAGTYSLSYNTTTTTANVRLEFDTPTGMVPSLAGVTGATNGTDVQFVTTGTTNANLALVFPHDYAPTNPSISIARQVAAVKVDGSAQSTSAGTLFTNPYATTGNTGADPGNGTIIKKEATVAQTGSIWGVANYRDSAIFSAAYLRRHAALGNSGLGGIYLTTPGGATDASAFATVANAGTNPRGVTVSNPGTYNYFNDVSAFANIGKIGLGGMTIAPDYSALYVVNLNTKALVRIPLNVAANGTITAGTQTSYTIPSPTCTGTNRPFGVGSGNGALWVTNTCTGTAAADLKASVYRFDPTTNTFATTAAFTTTLSGYARGDIIGGTAATWNAWNDNTSNFNNGVDDVPMPLASDVAFDSNGDMTIGIKDRFADQTGKAGIPVNNSNTLEDGYSAGDVLRACGGPTSWTLESNGRCGTRTGYGVGNAEGPGGGEFYDDNYTSGGTNHDQTSLSGMLQVPGFPQVIDTVFDPQDDGELESFGYRFLNNANGTIAAHRQVGIHARQGDQSQYGKAGGMGDLDLLVDPPVEIGNRLWIDTDRDGIQEPGEPAVSGVQVRLYNAAGTTVLATTTTNANGEYYFNNANYADIAPGTNYVIRIDRASDYASGGALFSYVPTTKDAGSKNTIDSDTALVSSYPQMAVTTPTYGANHTYDAGFVKKAVSVGDYVFIDTNKNGIQDAGDTGLAGVTVSITGPGGTTVTDVFGNAVTTDVTDSAGKYSFENLPALASGQSYTVTINNNQAALAAYAPTLTGQGNNANDSSNGTAASGNLVNNGDSDNTLDFGFTKKAVSVGDFVFVDTNRDGIQNSGEPGIQGVTLTIVGPAGAAVTDVNGNTVGPVVTNAAGAYTFANLPTLTAGQSYTVKVDNNQAALAAYAPTLTGQGNNANDSSNGSAASGTLTANGASDLTLDFGFVKKAVSVGDFVWFDTNGNGVQDSGEAGISGVTVTITKADGTAVTNVNGTAVTSTTTDANGKYSFDLLPAGVAYKVSIDNNQTALANGGYVPTQSGQGNNANDSSNGSATSTVLTTNGNSDLTLDFGFIKKAVSVGDFVFVDTNRNGIQNAGEPGISGVTVTITRTDGATVKTVTGTTVTSTTTDANGAYLFINLEALPAGTHYVTAINNGQAALSAYIPTLANQGADRAVDSSTSTSESGNLTTNGASDRTLDFGFIKPAVSVGDFLWNDLNGNGIQDAGEPGISGVTVTITKADGTPVADVNGNLVTSTVTDGNGKYSFDLLPAGVPYKVSIDGNQNALNGYTPTLANQGGDNAKDSSTGSVTSVVLAGNGASDKSLDFGFVKKSVSVGDFVFVDTNRNGIQNAGEPGITGINVTITRTDGATVKTVTGTTVTSTTTDGNGKYLFSNLEALPAGTHYVTAINNNQAALSAYVPTLANQGGDTSKDSSTSTSESKNLPNNGDSDLTLDYGFIKPAVSVGDYVFVDANGNGIQDAGDTPLSGVKLTIVGPDGNPVTDVNGNPVGPQTTGANGAYSFDLLPTLPAGQHYTVKVDNAQAALQGYVPTLTGQGTPATDSSNGSGETGNLTTNGASDKTIDFGFKAAAPSIKLDKSASSINDLDNNGPDAGDQITYSFKVTNNGDVTLTNITVTDPMFPGGITCPSAPLAVGDSVDCAQKVHTLTNADITTAHVDNTAKATGTAPNGDKVNDTDSTTTPVNAVSVSVGDFVFLDTDRDGIQDAGENGIPNVKLTIVGPDGNAGTDIYGNAVGVATTDANGKYSFDNLPILPAGQHYIVKVDNTQPALAAYVPTLANQGGDTAKDSSTASAESGNLTTGGASDKTLDFGFVKPAVSVGDFLWNDLNGNGIQDAGEPGIPGVKVTITNLDGSPVVDVNGNPVGTATTDASGTYSFDLLPAGVAYKVSVDGNQNALNGYAPTLANQGGDNAKDSSTGTATTVVITGNGGSDKTLDFGFIKKAVSVGDFVFVDTNRNGIQNAGEPGISGVTVTITRTDGATVKTVTGTTVTSTTTDANGAYLFINLEALPAGTHYVTAINNGQAALSAYIPTLANQGADRAVDSSTSTSESGNLTTNGASDRTLDFGFIKPAVSVGDYVFIDANGNGIQDAGDNGLQGVVLTIVGPGGNTVTDVFGNPVGPVTTDVNGAYSFDNLPALPAGQSYTVKVDNTQPALAGFSPTLTGQGNATNDSSNGSGTSGNLTTNGASDKTIDFGFVYANASIQLDKTASAIDDVDGNGPDAGDKITFSFKVTNTGLVKLDPVTVSDPKVGPVSCPSGPLAAGASVTCTAVVYMLTQADVNAGSVNNTAKATGTAPNGTKVNDDDSTTTPVSPWKVTVGDYVFVDNNGNGIQDAGDTGLSGVVVTIVGPDGNPVTDVFGNPVGSQTTNGNGSYTFTNLPTLPAGQGYTVKVENNQPALADYTSAPTGQGTPATDSSNGSGTTGNLTSNGASDTTIDFGFVPNKPAIRLDKTASSINDLDGNGPDAGDTITYSFKVTNTGNTVLTNITVTDPMFAGGISCPAAPLAKGGSANCTQQTHTLTGADVTAGTVDNTAKAEGTSPTGTKVNDTDSTSTPVVSVTGVANIKVNKTVDNATPNVGDTVTYTITVTNTGDADADNVVLKDLVPSGLTFVSASAPCTQAAGSVECALGTLAAGAVKTVTIKATVDNVPAGTTEERHGIDVQKAEAVLDLDAGQTASKSVTCQSGYVLLDGSARVVHVDGGTGTFADVDILESRATSLDTWNVTLRNNATGRAQNKVFTLCVKKETETVNNHSHELQVSAASTTTTVALPSGRSDVTLACLPGETVVQPGFQLDGSAVVQTSYPRGSNKWTFGVDNEDATNGTFSIRCMKNQVTKVNGHDHDLALADLFRTVTVPAGQTVDVVLDCADSALGNQGAKGIVAGYDLAPGLLHLGNEPQPIRRVFTLSNPTGSDLQADLYLLCLATRTAGHDGSGTIVNTASATTTSPELTTNDNTSSASLKVTVPTPTQQDKTNLKVTKTVDNATPRVGDVVTYTIKVANNGEADADNVVLTDNLPAGVSFTSASAPCTRSGATVSCDLGSVAKGDTVTVTVKATVDSVPAADSAHAHNVDVQKVESYIGLGAGDTKTVTADCAPGYLATDGSGRVDQIDQGSGTPDAVRIIASQAIDEDTWSVTMENNASGNAQGHVFAVCVKKQTEQADGHQHDLVYTAPVTKTQALTAGENTVTLACGPGTTAIAPSYALTGDAAVRSTYPAGNGWSFVVDADSAASGAFAIRCLSTDVSTADGHTHSLQLTPITQTATVQSGQTLEVTSSCAGDAKGVVAGFTMGKGLVQIGNDPRPIIRVFRFYNPTNRSIDVDLWLLCQNNRTTANTGSGTVVNTAYASTSTPESTTADNSDSASFKVSTTPAAAPVAAPASSSVKVSRTSTVTTKVTCKAGSASCKGTAVLIAAKTQKINGKVVKKGTVLAKGAFKIRSGKSTTVKLKPTRAGKKVLRAKALKKATMKVGKKQRSVAVRR